MGKLADFVAANWELILLYLAVVVIALVGIYLILAYANIEAKRRNARLLKELCDASGWADMVKLIRSEEYVSAVLRACEIVMEG